ncbi:MAG: YXWGXW repeat-containing protein, partial [Acidobacteriaceae bacterium]
MSTIGRILFPTALLAFALAGCHSNQNQAQSPSSDDPAAVNLANASNTTDTASNENPPPPPPDQGGSSQAAPPPDQSGYDDQASGDRSAGYADTAYDVASDPPPPIPEYDQPACPGDDYEWTPGYWGYDNDGGYYWVPGAWVMAPYVGALWTPGYWGYSSGRYRWSHGYWGPHIGFYGGVNYGYGYGGNGYEGGYWRGSNFYYNTAVSRVNVSVVRNVYNYRVTNVYNNSHVSFNGGNGGLNYRPTPQQVAARNDRHIAPLPAQRSFAQSAMQSRTQFASQNHGRPQMVAESRPVTDGRSAPASRPEDYHPAPAPRPEAARPVSGAQPGSGARTPVGAPRPQPGAG